MNHQTIETEVLIIGGGPVGLAMALELRYQGIDCVLVEQSDGVIDHPKVGTVGPRSMEIFRRWGVAQSIRDAGWPADHPLDVAWVTAVGKHEIHRLKFGSHAERTLPPHSPESEHPCPHHWLVPLLIKELGIAPAGPINLNCRMESLESTQRGIVGQIKFLESGDTATVEAKYAVACDGASSVIRKTCGIDTLAHHPTRIFQNILFQAPELPEILGSRRALVFFMMTPDNLRYPLRSMDGVGLYRLTATPHEDGTPRDSEKAVKEAVGIDTPIEILSTSLWYLTHRVATDYQSGNIFFVGDSAHTLSPSGGFGMNTGVSDALDLGWKLAAVLRGWAGSQLLETYQTERHPLAVAAVEEANLNLERTIKRTLPPEIMLESPEGERARAQMTEKMKHSDVNREFNAPGIHFGFYYESPAIATEPEKPAVQKPDEWTPTSYPGSRAPHAWLEANKSTLDLFGHGLVLLNFGDRDVTALIDSCQAKKVPLRTYQIDDREIAKTYEKTLVLVRPDGHVAWRGDNLPDDLDGMVDRIRGYF
jgi:flavin-dependent monooxygenase StaC